MFKEAKNKKPHLCVAYRCLNNKGTNDRFCYKHRKRYKKETNLLAYTYDLLKQNAKRRKKIFTISLDYFRKWCRDNNYLKLKGKSAKSASIDRDNPNLGYVEGNLKLLSLSANSKKHHTDKEINYPF